MKPMRRVGWMVALVVATTAGDCGGPVTISETEIWWLELEQTGDGSTSPYPSRGTITMRLRANTTSGTGDPTCPEHARVMTFLADVEALPSRLQDPGSGTADGSVNCHGFAATVRLADGTRYELMSDEPSEPFRSEFDEVRRWTAGARHGQYMLQKDSARIRAGRDGRIRQSHFTLLVQNRSDDDLELALSEPTSLFDPVHIEYRLAAFDEDGTRKLAYADVPPSGTTTLNWPSHGVRGAVDLDDDVFRDPVPREVSVRPPERTVLGRRISASARVVQCLLGPDHPTQIHFIIQEDGELDCGEGWVGRNVYVAVARSPLFIRIDQAAVTDTVTVHRFGAIPTGESSHPAIGAGLTTHATDPFRASLLTVTVAANAPRIEHGITIRASSTDGEDTATVFLPVNVYELSATVTPATLTIPHDGSDSAEVQVATVGVFSPLRFSIESVHGMTFRFAPSPATDFGSTLTVDVGAAAAPGTYDLTVCTALTWDPQEICHPAPLTVVVTAGTNEAPVVTIHTPQDGVTFTAGDPIEFSASASDAEDGALTGAALVWTSDVDGTLGTGEVVVRNDLSVGSHTITLQGTDSGGATDVATVSITIIPAGAVRRGS